jgi:hypothetical protein
VAIKTRGGHQIVLDDMPGTGGITVRTAMGTDHRAIGTGAKSAMARAGM